MTSVGREPLEHRLTQRDLDCTPDDGNRYEIIDGRLYVTPFPTYAHQQAVTQLVTLLNNHVRQNRTGRVFAAGLKVVLDEPSGIGPDVVFVSTARMVDMQADGYYGAPDLVVEVLSSKPELDRFVKLHKYADAGVAHYWIVDAAGRTLSAYRLEAGRYALAWEGEGDATFEPELFRGLRIDLAELWV